MSDKQKVTGEITDVEYFSAPNDTTYDENDGHFVTIDGEQYWLRMDHESPTAEHFEVDGDSLEIEGAFVEAEYRVIEGRRGNEHRVLENIEIMEADPVEGGA